VIHIWPLILYGAAALAVVAGMLSVSAVLGQRHREGATDEPYESGIAATGSTQVRFNAKFYLMAMFVCSTEPEIPAALPAVSLIGKFGLATITAMLFWLGIAPSAIINLLAAAFG
jgi:NADH-quinone oxidoreductase subunit A